MKKRILIYNWAQFDDPKNRGGGVSVYLKNLIPNYIQADIDVIFISSGCHYSLFRKDVFFQQTDNIFSNEGVTSYRIINSPIKAPAHDSFFQIENCLDNQEIIEVFMKLLAKIGDVDEIHIHNIEGISTILVETLSQRTKSKIVAWFHNYHWFCPQIELFKNSKEKCADYNSGYDCIGCLPKYSNVNKKIAIHKLVSHLELSPIYNNFLGKKLEKFVKNIFLTLRSFVTDFNLMSANMNSKADLNFSERTAVNTKSIDDLSLQAQNYQKWRELNILRINNYVDVCIAVSGLVAEKITSLGVNKEKVIELPLGMDVYNPHFVDIGLKKAKKIKHPLKIGFVGYANESKGLSFLCQSLLSLNVSNDSLFSFHIFSKVDENVSREIVRLCRRFELHLTKGYNRVELPLVASEIDLLVVPSIWWETYNQVSYEMLMNGVPVLISNSVGISEYLNQKFIFEGGSIDSLVTKLEYIINNPSSLTDYWSDGEFLVPSLKDHYYLLEENISKVVGENDNQY